MIDIIEASPIFDDRPSGITGSNPVVLDFFDAMRMVLAGKKVTKLEWSDEKIFAYLRMDRLMLHKNDDKDYIWEVSYGDMSGTDYIVLPE